MLFVNDSDFIWAAFPMENMLSSAEQMQVQMHKHALKHMYFNLHKHPTEQT